jgi:hypothetical protein
MKHACAEMANPSYRENIPRKVVVNTFHLNVSHHITHSEIMFTKQLPKEPDREHRILYEAVVDCYDEVERAMGWYYYLEQVLAFPFQAQCQSVRKTSPLAVGEIVRVVSLADEDDCMSEVMVDVEYDRGTISVPLVQLTCITQQEATCQGIGDWHYWVARGYRY